MWAARTANPYGFETGGSRHRHCGFLFATGPGLGQSVTVTHGVRVAALAGALLLMSGCADQTEILPPEVAPVEAYTPVFDGSLEPAAAVLPLVPEDVDTLTVTDFEQVRLQLGLPDLSTDDKRADRDSFWARATAELPLLSTGMLRPIERKLKQDHGLSQLDVAWEAHFLDEGGSETGYVLAFRDGTDMAAVADAVAAGFAVFEDATVDAELRLVTAGVAPDGEQSWAVDADARALVGPPANATYLSRGCTDEPVDGDLDELALYSVQFEGALATARLGENREDLFTRMRAGQQLPEFDAVFSGGVADPLTGRIGYVMADPAAAAALALSGSLPFAACA